MSTTAMSVYEWNTLNWRAIEKHVFKLAIRGFIKPLVVVMSRQSTDSKNSS